MLARLKLTKDKGEEERNNHVRHEQMKAQRHASHAGVIVHYVFLHSTLQTSKFILPSRPPL
jgi:hypothetical protein